MTQAGPIKWYLRTTTRILTALFNAGVIRLIQYKLGRSGIAYDQLHDHMAGTCLRLKPVLGKPKKENKGQSSWEPHLNTWIQLFLKPYPWPFLSCVSHSLVSDSLRTHGLQPTRLLCPWNSPGKNTKVECHSLLQRIFPPQGSTPGLLHCRQILHHFSHQKSPVNSVKYTIA